MSLSLSACTTSAFLENTLAVATGLGGNAHSTPSKMVQPTSTSTSTSNTDDICKPTEVKVVLQDGNQMVERCMKKPSATTNTQPNPFHEESKEESGFDHTCQATTYHKRTTRPNKANKNQNYQSRHHPQSQSPHKEN